MGSSRDRQRRDGLVRGKGRSRVTMATAEGAVGWTVRRGQAWSVSSGWWVGEPGRGGTISPAAYSRPRRASSAVTRVWRARTSWSVAARSHERMLPRNVSKVDGVMAPEKRASPVPGVVTHRGEWPQARRGGRDLHLPFDAGPRIRGEGASSFGWQASAAEYPGRSGNSPIMVDRASRNCPRRGGWSRNRRRSPGSRQARCRTEDTWVLVVDTRQGREAGRKNTRGRSGDRGAGLTAGETEVTGLIRMRPRAGREEGSCAKGCGTRPGRGRWRVSEDSLPDRGAQTGGGVPSTENRARDSFPFPAALLGCRQFGRPLAFAGARSRARTPEAHESSAAMGDGREAFGADARAAPGRT